MRAPRSAPVPLPDGARSVLGVTVTETEQARLTEAREKARTVPDVEHVTFRWRDRDPEDFVSCVKCGLIKPRNGWPDGHRCKGWARIAPRSTP